MSYKTKSDLLSDISTNINDNTAGEISPADVRTRLQDITDSSYRSLATTGASANVIDNNDTEQTVASFTVPGGALGTDRSVTLVAYLRMLNDSGSSQGFTFRVKYGATTMYADATSSTLFNTNANHRMIRIEATLFAENSATAQRLGGQFYIGAAGTATTGTGDAGSTTNSLQFAFGGTAAENSATDQTFAITMQLTAANASYEIIRDKAVLFLN